MFMKLNTRLLEVIEYSGLKKLVIAERTGLTAKKLGEIVRGRREPTRDEKKKLARVLDREVMELFREV